MDDLSWPRRQCPGLPEHGDRSCPNEAEPGDRWCAGCRAEWDGGAGRPEALELEQLSDEADEILYELAYRETADEPRDHVNRDDPATRRLRAWWNGVRRRRSGYAYTGEERAPVADELGAMDTALDHVSYRRAQLANGRAVRDMDEGELGFKIRAGVIGCGDPTCRGFRAFMAQAMDVDDRRELVPLCAWHAGDVDAMNRALEQRRNERRAR